MHNDSLDSSKNNFEFQKDAKMLKKKKVTNAEAMRLEMLQIHAGHS